MCQILHPLSSSQKKNAAPARWIAHRSASVNRNSHHISDDVTGSTVDTIDELIRGVDEQAEERCKTAQRKVFSPQVRVLSKRLNDAWTGSLQGGLHEDVPRIPNAMSLAEQ